MRLAKTLGLAAMALAALMAIAGTASATTLTSPSGTTYTSTIKLENTGSITLTGCFGCTGSISCNKSIVETKVETHGTSATVGGNITKLTFEVCAGGTPRSPVGGVANSGKRGSFQIHGTSTTGSGTWTGFNTEIIVDGTALGTCIFWTESTGSDLGTLTGSNVTKGNAVLDFSGTIPGSCGAGTLEGQYKVVTPSTLEVH